MLLSFILIIILLYTYYYLVELAHCKCFHKDKVDLEYMKFYVLLDLFTIIISLFLMKSKLNTIENMLLLFSVLLVIFVHGYMTYNVYHFYNSIRNDCYCVNKWQKYMVYYEGIFSGLVSLQYIVAFLFILTFLINTRS
jgi:hypothetical protein